MCCVALCLLFVLNFGKDTQCVKTNNVNAYQQCDY